MTPGMLDYLWRYATLLPPFRPMVDVWLHRAISRGRGEAVKKWMWRRQDIAHRPAQQSFHPTLIGRAGATLRENPDKITRGIFDRLIKQGVLPSADTREACLIALANHHEFELLFALARILDITKREATLVFVIFQGALDTAEGDAAAHQWLDEFKPDPMKMHHFRDLDKTDGSLNMNLKVDIATVAFRRGSNELLMKMLDGPEHLHPFVVQGLIGRKRPLSVDVVARMERMKIRWGSVLEVELPDATPVQRLSDLATMMEPEAGNLLALIAQAQASNRAEDDRALLQAATPLATTDSTTAASAAPRRRI